MPKSFKWWGEVGAEWPFCTGSHRQGFQIFPWPGLSLATETVHAFSNGARFPSWTACELPVYL